MNNQPKLSQGGWGPHLPLQKETDIETLVTNFHLFLALVGALG